MFTGNKIIGKTSSIIRNKCQGTKDGDLRSPKLCADFWPNLFPIDI